MRIPDLQEMEPPEALNCFPAPGAGPQIAVPRGVAQRHDPAAGYRLIDPLLRRAAAQRSIHKQTSYVRPERRQEARHGILGPRDGAELMIVQFVASCHKVVISNAHKGVAGVAVHLQELLRPEATIGLCRVAVKLNFAVLTGNSIGITNNS